MLKEILLMDMNLITKMSSSDAGSMSEDEHMT